MSNPLRRAAVAPKIVVLAALALASAGCVFAIGTRKDCDENCTNESHHSSKQKAHCPVTREAVSKSTAPSATVDGDTYYFHCNTCKQQFLAEPGAYLHGGAESGSAHDEDAAR